MSRAVRRVRLACPRPRARSPRAPPPDALPAIRRRDLSERARKAGRGRRPAMPYWRPRKYTGARRSQHRRRPGERGRDARRRSEARPALRAKDHRDRTVPRCDPASPLRLPAAAQPRWETPPAGAANRWGRCRARAGGRGCAPAASVISKRARSRRTGSGARFRSGRLGLAERDPERHRLAQGEEPGVAHLDPALRSSAARDASAPERRVFRARTSPAGAEASSQERRLHPAVGRRRGSARTRDLPRQAHPGLVQAHERLRDRPVGCASRAAPGRLIPQPFCR